MKKKKQRSPLYQWCIKETYVSEVLSLPSELTIDSITFEIGFSLKRTISTIPDSLKQLGVSSLREPCASMEAMGTLHGSRTKLTSNAKDICKALSLDYRHMRVRRLMVSYKGTTAYFTRMTKNMDTGAEDKTQRIKVLGLVKHDGTDVGINAIIKLITAKKINCVYSVKPITTVICSE